MTDKIQHPRGVSDNRYLYYPDHLVKLPSRGGILGAAKSFLTEPLWSGVLGGALHLLRTRNTQGVDGDREHYEETGMMPDESVAEFVTRITGEPRFVDNILSGMMHGIYGGDVHKLSAKQTILEKMWYFHNYPVPRDQQSKMQPLWSYQDEWYLVCDMMMSPNRLKIIELAEHAVDWKLLAFEDGLVSLIRGLVRGLEKKRNVTFEFNSPVTSLEHKKGEILVSLHIREPSLM
jgi:protoporphyrinogen/coproporphyrinogen III oxidase